MRPLDHALVAVGYGTTAEGQDFWVLKNSWGAHWGERGFMYVPRNTGGKGACGLAAAPGYAVRRLQGRRGLRGGDDVGQNLDTWAHAASSPGGTCGAAPAEVQACSAVPQA